MGVSSEPPKSSGEPAGEPIDPRDQPTELNVPGSPRHETPDGDATHPIGSDSEGQSGAKEPVPKRIGRYEVIKKIGRGGMGSVYLAKDPQLDRMVAIKVPHETRNERDDSQARFWREARTAAKLHHANICPVHEIGEADGKQFLVMAFIEGTPLSTYLEKVGRLPQREAALVARKIALAMQEAHRLQIVHRDLKPSNVLIDRHNEPIVMDFGLAWQKTDSEIRLTRQGVVVGTPAYMPPEQIHRKLGPIGPPTDVYSLGVMLYELLTGKLPFDGNFASVVAQVVARKPPPPTLYRPDLDPKLEAICLKAMAKKAEERYPDMGAMAADLTDYLKNPTPAEPLVELEEPDVVVLAEPPPPPRPPRASGAQRATSRSSVQRAPDSGRRRAREEEPLKLTMSLLIPVSVSIAVLIAALAVYNRFGGTSAPAGTAASVDPVSVTKDGPAGTRSEPISNNQRILAIRETEREVRLPAGAPIVLKVEFPGEFTLEGKWAIASVHVIVDGETVQEESFAEATNWGTRFSSTRLSAVVPFVQLSAAATAALARPGKVHQVEVSAELTFPKLVAGDRFTNEFKTVTRRFAATVAADPTKKVSGTF